MEVDIFAVLKEAVVAGASDVHLAPNRVPMMRVRGEVEPINDSYPVLTDEMSKEMIYGILTDDQRLSFEQNMELDCSYQIPNFARFRVNVHSQKDGVGSVMRTIQSQIPSPDDLGIGESILKVTDWPRGLVLVTGPTGSGKSTTLAALIDVINQKRHEHILTIEDPIEFVFTEKNCVITQRELHQSTKSFANALRAALRQDPDVIMIGEMRDLETIELALTAAETGHLVFATLHTTDASQTIDRIVDVFPHQQQQMVRTQLGGVLKAVVSQALLPTADNKGRIAAREILVVDNAIGTMIREGRTQMIYGAIDVGTTKGMISLERDLERLVRAGDITLETALSKANRQDSLFTYLSDYIAEKAKSEPAAKKTFFGKKEKVIEEVSVPKVEEVIQVEPKIEEDIDDDDDFGFKVT